MQQVIAFLSLLGLTGIMILIVPIFRRLTAQRLDTFYAAVLEKTQEKSIIYTGVFVPFVINYLIVETGSKVKVSKSAFNAVEVGDSVVVSEYSDGTCRLESYARI
jgi:hypothetical protein